LLRMIKEDEPPRPSARLSDSGEALACTRPADHVIDNSVMVGGIRNSLGGCHDVRLVHLLPC